MIWAHVPDLLRGTLGDLDLLVLEANHDEAMLRAGPYPPSVAERIGGRRGHLSNRSAATLARQVVHPGLRHVVLAHLSEQCNTPQLAASTVNAALTRTRFRGAVTPALQDVVAGPFAAGAGRRVARSAAVQQLTLEL